MYATCKSYKAGWHRSQWAMENPSLACRASPSQKNVSIELDTLECSYSEVYMLDAVVRSSHQSLTAAQILVHLRRAHAPGREGRASPLAGADENTCEALTLRKEDLALALGCEHPEDENAGSAAQKALAARGNAVAAQGEWLVAAANAAARTTQFKWQVWAHVARLAEVLGSHVTRVSGETATFASYNVLLRKSAAEESAKKEWRP
ncbi:MAG: hypothetical protein SGPRY_010034 [Prymnesium sp.]